MMGTTEPNADIKITYDGNDYYVQADNTGEFIYSYSPALPSGTKISFVSNVAGSFYIVLEPLKSSLMVYLYN